jgi:hypothetical protein
MPGVKLCDELSRTPDGNDNAVAERTKQLEEFSDKAQAAVRALISKVCYPFSRMAFS